MGLFSSLWGTKPQLPEQAILLDVRSPAEFSSGAIEGAKSVPLDQLVQKIQKVLPDKDLAIIVYCRSGARSSQAVALMAQLGYTQLFNGGGVATLALQLQKRIVT